MSITVTAPAGAHFEFDEVKTARGTQSLGEVPILVWDSVDAALSHYGEDGVREIFDGTSLRVSFQNMARRMKAAGKSDDEIASAEINFRPGKRQTGDRSTPASRAQKLARTAAEQAGGDAVNAFLEKVLRGEIVLNPDGTPAQV